MLISGNRKCKAADQERFSPATFKTLNRFYNISLWINILREHGAQISLNLFLPSEDFTQLQSRCSEPVIGNYKARLFEGKKIHDNTKELGNPQLFTKLGLQLKNAWQYQRAG